MSFKPENFTIWAEIPVTDLDKGVEFYQKVFQTELMVVQGVMGNMLAMFPTASGRGRAGHLYPGKPAPRGTGPTIHLIVPDRLEDAAGRFTEAGGRVVSDPVAAGPGRCVYAEDPDGNSIGLFEAS